MSKRRQAGDRVFVKAGAGFGASRGEWGKILPEPPGRENDFCMLDCGDDDCCEWCNVRTEKVNFCHVSECEMFDSEEEAMQGEGNDTDQ